MKTIAIIGMGCRFPGTNDPESFWELLHQIVVNSPMYCYPTQPPYCLLLLGFFIALIFSLALSGTLKLIVRQLIFRK